MRKTAAVVDMIYATAERYSVRLYLKEHYHLIFHTQGRVIYMNIVPYINFIRLPYTGHILKWFQQHFLSNLVIMLLVKRRVVATYLH